MECALPVLSGMLVHFVTIMFVLVHAPVGRIQDIVIRLGRAAGHCVAPALLC